MLRARVLALGLSCMGIARATLAQGGPPLETDDPGTPGPGHLELNLSIEAEREGAGTSYDAPRLDANLGVGTRFQLKLEVPWRVVAAPRSRSRTGFGNVVAGFKWRFAQTGSVALSTYPQVTFVGSERAGLEGVADTGTTLLMPVEFAWHSGPIALNAEAGYQRDERRSELVYGLALGRELGSSLELLAECHGSGDADLDEQGVLCGAGARWNPEDRVGVLAAYAIGVAGSAATRPDRRWYTGAQLRW
jgi:hypothetical protein